MKKAVDAYIKNASHKFEWIHDHDVVYGRVRSKWMHQTPTHYDSWYDTNVEKLNLLCQRFPTQRALRVIRDNYPIISMESLRFANGFLRKLREEKNGR